MIKWMVVVFFMCGEPAGIVTNNDALREIYQDPSAQVVPPKIEELDIRRINIEDISGLVCV